MPEIKICVSLVQQQVFVLFGYNYIILTVVLIMSFFTQHDFFVTATDVGTEAFAGLRWKQWLFLRQI